MNPSDLSPDDWTLLVTGLLGGGGFAAIVVKLLSRGGDAATAESIRANARKADIENLRSIIDELRAARAADKQDMTDIKRRLTTLEERERHMLTRAAVHEAWDQLALNYITGQGETGFPKPPPLSIEGEEHGP